MKELRRYTADFLFTDTGAKTGPLSGKDREVCLGADVKEYEKDLAQLKDDKEYLLKEIELRRKLLLEKDKEIERLKALAANGIDLANMLEEAEAKLAKAVEALTWYAGHDGYWGDKAKAVLAEIGGDAKPDPEAAMLQAVPENEFEMDCMAEIRGLWDRVEKAEKDIIKLGRGEPIGTR